MTATIHATEVDRYVADVAAHLGALPEAERAELLDDLRDHLAEVAAEDDGSLVARLGSPAAYAADLLASAGLVPDGARPWRDQLRAIWTQVQGSAPYQATIDLLSELRPAWWALRGVALVFAVNVLLVNGSERTWPWPGTGPFDRPLVLLPLCAGVVASLAAGRWSASGGRSRLVTLGNAAVLVLTWWAVTLMRDVPLR